MIRYQIELTPDDNGAFLVTCPDLPEVSTFGLDEADCISRASDAVAEAVAARLADYRPIPHSHEGAAALSLHMTMIVTLAWALADRGWTRADLQRALGWHRPQVDRLFDPNHASTLARFEAAFRALDREPVFVARAA